MVFKISIFVAEITMAASPTMERTATTKTARIVEGAIALEKVSTKDVIAVKRKSCCLIGHSIIINYVKCHKGFV